MLERITDLIRNAVELNLRYTSTLLHLSKDYLRDINGIIATQTRGRAGNGGAQPTTGPAPLQLAGRRGETANAAFPLNNTTGRDMQVNLVVQGEFGAGQVRLEPASLQLAKDEQAIVRIFATIDEKMPVGQDRVGAIAAPGASSQAIGFIVRRRLPDADVEGKPAGRRGKAQPAD
jgi:hypothetical protein